MIIKREKFYIKKDGLFTNLIKSESYWLFGFIPLFINHRIVERKI